MSSEEIVIDVSEISKCYEIYNSPRDRLKQLVLPSMYRAVNRLGVSSGLSRPSNPPKYFRDFWALQNISFQVERGETFGIIGRNGSGKSTLLQILAGTLAQSSGNVSVHGRIAALLELGSGFNPDFTGSENVFLNGRILGLTQKEIEDRYEQIVGFADIGDFINQPVKTYSSGMFVRLAFAVQAHIDASIVIIDEALAVGDVFFRQKCYSRLEQLRNSGAAILLVSHSMPDIEQYCKKAILLDHGRMKFIGTSSDAAKYYYLMHQPQICQKNLVSSPAISNLDGALPLGYPSNQDFIKFSRQQQISNGRAYCSRFVLCNEFGQSCVNFQQSELAVFYYEFELDIDIEIPLCGLIITNDRGVIVHGKNAWQTFDEVPKQPKAGSKVFCRQEVALKLAPGEYTFEIGMAEVTLADWERRMQVSHDEWASLYSTVCVVTNAGQFSVGFATKNGISTLTHHGVADLPGNIKTHIV